MSHEDFTKELDALRENLPETVEETVPSKTSIQFYNSDLAEKICDYVVDGKSLYWIAENVSEMPAYTTLTRWLRVYPEFSALLRSARAARAYLFEDKAIEAAEKAEDPKEVPAARLKFDAYCKGAEWNDPATYGKKVEHKGEVAQKIILNVVTGFGPLPDALKFPKLNQDGTICKDVPSEVIDVSPEQKEVADGKTDGPRSSENDSEAHAPRDERSAQDS